MTKKTPMGYFHYCLERFTSCRDKLYVFLLLLCIFSGSAKADNDYRLWLKYDRIENGDYLQEARNLIKANGIHGDFSTLNAANEELARDLSGLLDINPSTNYEKEVESGSVAVGKAADIPLLQSEQNSSPCLVLWTMNERVLTISAVIRWAERAGCAPSIIDKKIVIIYFIE